MKFFKIILFQFMFMATFQTCKEKDVSKWSENEVEEWFQNSPWKLVAGAKPDSSIDKKLLVEQMHFNPASWATALKFLQETDLLNIEVGKYPLSGDGTYATVTDYSTRDSGFFEAHRKFIDIQLVPQGQEYIFIAGLAGRNIQKPYNEQKDIEFFEQSVSVKRLADAENYFIFFPQQGHMPCMAIKEQRPVRKIVVKIPFKDNLR